MIVLVTVSDAGAGSYWLVRVAVAEPPAGIVTVSGSDGVVVTCTRRGAAVDRFVDVARGPGRQPGHGERWGGQRAGGDRERRRRAVAGRGDLDRAVLAGLRAGDLLDHGERTLDRGVGVGDRDRLALVRFDRDRDGQRRVSSSRRGPGSRRSSGSVTTQTVPAGRPPTTRGGSGERGG